ncbi:hypothetical protein NY2A_b821R [Paramecium bursaria Chlorella virus NY2A]|uniref:Uncharacterized protein b821R n=1 Tax=Paramecium bursaria Chlorella virus NY2A TaxID=46021 RepID=A7IXZ6_PBCVN|nr:hypothetical protein NY2A_b821R [Paramecium bursaria Chlorella virus NY2A]ABT15220.1 hypothetical protein NY2A_b821R [Paramecium bursaria Chlorella virus NY2A]
MPVGIFLRCNARRFYLARRIFVAIFIAIFVELVFLSFHDILPFCILTQIFLIFIFMFSIVIELYVTSLEIIVIVPRLRLILVFF